MAKIVVTTPGAGEVQQLTPSNEQGSTQGVVPLDRNCIGPQQSVVTTQVSVELPITEGEVIPDVVTEVAVPVVTPAPPSLPLPEVDPNEGKYDGDKVDNSGPLPSNTSGNWETLGFESPLELIYAIDSTLREATDNKTLHAWQIEVLEELAFLGKPKEARPTLHKPHRFALCAANGSGKDQYIVAPFVIWFALTKIRSLTIITSSSGVQLTAQTENYIASLARSVNTFFGEPIFKITRRFIKCLKSGSEIRLFATDEAGKAEGYHPFSDYSNAEMAIIVNEAKSVSPEIFGALSRCTGYNYWLNVSTPNEPIGDFYDSFSNWPNRRRVTAFDCPHIPVDHINELRRKYGEHSAIYRSQVLALFTSIGGSVVIDQDHLNRCIEVSKKGVTKPKRFGKVKIGIDTAAGRDENAATAIYGNEILPGLYFVEKDTTITEDKLHEWLNKMYQTYGKENCEIFADDGGVSHGILDHLVKRGHVIYRVLNQTRAFDHKQFANRGTEMWYNVRRMIEECVLYLPMPDLNVKDSHDHKLYHQLAYRHFKKNEISGRIALMSKSDEKSEGHASPDRADALALALSSVRFDDIEKAIKDTDKKESGYTFAQLNAMKFEEYRANILNNGVASEYVKGYSLEALLAAKGIH